jgi:hypothetical protein
MWLPAEMHLPSVPVPQDLRALVERGAEFVDQLVTAVPRLTALLTAGEALVVRGTLLMDRIEATRAHAEDIAAQAEATEARADRLVTAAEPAVGRLLPLLERVADSVGPREVSSAVALLDTLPRLTARLEQDVLPRLSELSTVAPDIHDLLEASRRLNDLLGGVPGMGRIKKKVEEERAEDEAPDAAED